MPSGHKKLSIFRVCYGLNLTHKKAYTMVRVAQYRGYAKARRETHPTYFKRKAGLRQQKPIRIPRKPLCISINKITINIRRIEVIGITY